MKSIQLINKIIDLLSSDSSLYNRYTSEIKSLEQHKKQWEQDKIRIGVIGVTSSGKSTLINAILGDKLLSMAVKPSSSQLVCCSMSKQSKATIFFEDGNSINLNGKNLNSKTIKKYSDENYNANNIENVVQIELSTPNFELGEDILLIDSPGLDAYGLENHEQLTLEVLLPTIDVCIFVTTLKNNSDDKMRAILNLTAKYNCPLIIVQNMLDSVRPSVDGKKSAEDVANDHRRRVQRIIDKSNISDKDEVAIVQMSAMQALKGRCEKKFNFGSKKELKISNYNEFVKEVKKLVSKKRPNIENQRINTVDNKIQKIIKDAKEDIGIPIKSRNLRFEYEGLDTEILSYAKKIEEQISKTLNNLSLENIVESSEDRDCNGYYTQNYIKKVKKYVKQKEQDIIMSIGDVNMYLSDVSIKLNIPTRDIVSFNGLPSMPELKIKNKTVYEAKRVRKSGIGGKVGRFFGNILNNDWGYEYKNVPKTVVDNLNTKQQVLEYISRAQNLYGKEIYSWSRKTNVLINQLIVQIENRKDSFEARKKAIIESEKLIDIINKLDLVSKQVQFEKIPNLKSYKVSNNKSKANLREVRVNKSTYNIAQLANRLSNNININVNNFLLAECKSLQNSWIIIGWDLESISTFAKRFCSIILTEIDIRSLEYNAYLESDKYKFYYKPSKENTIDLKDRKYKHNVYILTNATQFGAAQNQISKSGICKNILEEDFLAFVIQDFNELVYGGGVNESINSMMTISKTLNIAYKSTILINNENPIYNLALVEAQLKNLTIQSDETRLLKKLQESFRYLRNEEVDKILADIIRATNKKGRV